MVSYNRHTQPGTLVHARPHTHRWHARIYAHRHTRTHTSHSRTLTLSHRTNAHTHMARPTAVWGEFHYNLPFLELVKVRKTNWPPRDSPCTSPLELSEIKLGATAHNKKLSNSNVKSHYAVTKKTDMKHTLLGK